MLFKKSALVVAASLLALGAAQAGTTAPASLAVSVVVSQPSVATSCTISASGMGTPNAISTTYVSGATTASSGMGSLSVSCGGNVATSFVASANAGSNASATSRRAALSGAFIDYQLTLMATGPGAAPVWDAATPTFGGQTYNGTTSGGTPNQGGTSFNLTVPAGQTIPTFGTYVDTVTLTATF